MSDHRSTITPPPCPFVGPVPFVEGQVLHGRKRETRDLANLLVGKRVVLLISPSGAGKTSLIQAALLPRLRSRLDAFPTVRLDRAPEAEALGANRYVLSTLHSIEAGLPEEQRLPTEDLARHTLASYLRERGGRPGEESRPRFKLLVLDQFEELFTLDRFDWQAKEAFLVQLGEALGRGPSDLEDDQEDEDGPPLWALLSMREDYVAELQPFLHLIPTGLSFRYRLSPLDREQAIEAVTGPAGDWFPRSAAEPLVDDLRTLSTLKRDGTQQRRPGRFVEPVQLQVVCLRLWDKVVDTESRPIDASDVEGEGNEVGTALADYYDGVIDEAATESGVRRRILRDWVEAELISHSRLRTRVLREPGPLDRALDVLIERHVLRVDLTGDREWIELSHDRLVDPVIMSNEAWREAHLALFQRQARLWAATGRRDDMLFSGPELTEALRFAEDQPESLTEDDRAFLTKSQKVRDRMDAERRRTQQIKKQRLGLAILGAFALAALLLTLLSYLRLEHQHLQMTLRQAVAMARGGASTEALASLIAVAPEIEGSRRKDLQLGLDQSLIEVLGSQPPMEQRITGHNHIVRSLRFTNEGRRLFSAGWDDRLNVWSIDGIAPRGQTLRGHGADIYALAHHPGRGLLVSTDRNGLVGLWALDGASPRLLATIDQAQREHTGRVAAAALSPDGTRLATASRKGETKRVMLWDLQDPADPVLLGTLGGRYHQAEIYRLAFIPDGPYAGALVSGGWTGRVGIWQTPESGDASGSQPDLALHAKTSQGGDAAIFSLAVSPSGRWISVGDHAGGIRAWDLHSDHQSCADHVLRFPGHLGHRGAVFDMAFSDDSTRLVSVGSDGVLLRWEIASAEHGAPGFSAKITPERFHGWGEKLYSVDYVPGSNDRVAVGGAKTIWLVDLGRPNPIASAIEGAGPWQTMAVTGQLEIISALANDKRRIRLWRLEEGEYRMLPTSIEAPWPLDRIALAPGGKTLVGLSCTGALVAWSRPGDRWSETPEQRIEAPPGERRRNGCAIAFSPAGDAFATGVGRALQLWSKAGAEDWQESDGVELDKGILTLAFDPAGDRLAAAGRLDRVLVWAVSEGRLVRPPESTEGTLEHRVLALAFTPDGRQLISGGDDAVAIAWKVPGLARVSQSDLHNRRLNALAMSRRAGYSVIFTGDAEGQIVICGGGVDEARCATVGPPSGKGIRGLAASPDLGRLIVSDGSLWVWDLEREALMDSARRLGVRRAQPNPGSP